MEESIEIPGYLGHYSVTSKGRVINDRTGRIMKLTNNKGYRKVNLLKDKDYTTYRVHRLVAQAFIPNPNEYPEVDHINEDKTDNRVENLRWCTNEMNKNYYNFGRCGSAVEKKKVYINKEDMIEKTGKPVMVNGELFKSAGSAAKMIADLEGKNQATISKEIRRMLQGKRDPWMMYGKYFIDSPISEEK